LDWVGVWRWRFGLEWVILISLMRMDCCGYSSVLSPLAGRELPDVHAVQCFLPPPPCSGISGDPSALFTAYPPRARAMQPAIPSLHR